MLPRFHKFTGLVINWRSKLDNFRTSQGFVLLFQYLTQRQIAKLLGRKRKYFSIWFSKRVKKKCWKIFKWIPPQTRARPCVKSLLPVKFMYLVFTILFNVERPSFSKVADKQRMTTYMGKIKQRWNFVLVMPNFNYMLKVNLTQPK